jgi:hypothetical protein
MLALVWMEAAFPIGGVGAGDPGTAVFYVDDEYGYVSESRAEPVLLRQAGTMGETDFLYATNAPIHPGTPQAPWRADSSGEWSSDEHAGWFPPWVPGKTNFETFLMSFKQPHMIGIGRSSYNSFYRNRSMYDILDR